MIKKQCYLCRALSGTFLLLLLTLICFAATACRGGVADGTETECTTDTVAETECTTDTVAETENNAVESGTTAPESESEFTLIDPTTVSQANMPRVDIATAGGVDITDRENYIRATISVSRCEEAYAFTDSPAGIRVRGNSTAAQVKKPYRIKFDEKQSFLGLNDGEEFKSWCLMADYFDPSFLRTLTTFRMAEALLEGKYYSSDCTPVEVYLNGVYHGVYLLCEQTQIDNDRVDIYEKEDGETSVKIGYLLIGQGGRYDEPDSVQIKPGITVTDRNGDSDHFGVINFALSGGDYTDAQKQYVSAYVSGVYKVISNALNHNYLTLNRRGVLSPKTDFVGTTPEEKQRETIAAVFDIDAAARMCVLDELVKNLDAMTFNMYVDLSPTGDGRLTLAAPWDFDFSMGNCRHENLNNPDGYYATNLTHSGEAGMRVNPLYVMLIQMPWFEDMVKEVWQAHYNDLRTITNDILVYAYRYETAYNRDYKRWERPISHFLPDHHDKELLESFKEHMDAANYLHDWLYERVAWLERRWGESADEPAPREPLLEEDFTTSHTYKYTEGAKRCLLSLSSGGLKVTVTDQSDPYFYITFDHLDKTFYASDYPILEITCLIPSTNIGQDLSMELFLCSGALTYAKAGVSTTVECSSERDVAVTYRIDLGKTGHWSGDIHRVRIDFDGTRNGDVVYIQSVKLLPQ